VLRRHAPSPVTAHWSKDFVEHLRTVHFTLIAVCVGLILILSRSNSPALSQIRQIVELKKEWPPRELAFVLQAKDNSNEVRVDIPGYGFDKELGGIIVQNADWKQRRNFSVTFTKPGSKDVSVVHFTFEVPAWCPAASAGQGLQEWNSLIQFPGTLTQFRSWWRTLAKQHPFYFSESVYHEGIVFFGLMRKPVPARLSEDFSPEADFSQAKSSDLVLQFVREDAIPGAEFFLAAEDKDSWHGSAYAFPLALYGKGSLDQDTILDVVNDRGWKWVKGTYERSFAALAQETSGLEAEDLEQVEKVVAERLATKSEEFEAFGMKFPIAQVTVWGTVILLGVQLYFFLYLKQLSGKLGPNDPGWDIPWICLDQSLLARMIFFTTVILLPLAAMLLIAFRASRRLTAGYWIPDSWHLLVPVRNWGGAVWLPIGAYCVAGLAALVLGILSWRFRPRLNQTGGEHCPAHLFE